MINKNVRKMKNTFYNLIWKKALLTAGVILLVFSFVNTASAQGLSSSAGSGSQLFCTRDYGNFITNGIDFDGEGFLDYWRDLLVIYNTNYCQYSDIASLQDRIDKARKQLRQAFYVCDDATVSRVTQDYYELSAELFYLRHFVETGGSPNSKSTEKEKAQKVAKRASVKAEFIEKFVKDKEYFDLETGEDVFYNLEQKYEGKLEAYRNCTDPNLEQLIVRLENLGNTFNTIENLGKRFAEKTERRFSAMQTRIDESPGLITMFSADSAGDFFKRVVDFRVNNEPVQDATVWESISNTAKENAPLYYEGVEWGPGKDGETPELPAINFGVIAGDIDTIEKRDKETELDLIYFAEYDLKFRQVQGLGLDQLRVNLENLKKTIKGTFEPLKRIGVCTANIVGKQCGK